MVKKRKNKKHSELAHEKEQSEMAATINETGSKTGNRRENKKF